MCTRMNYVRVILKDIILKDDYCESCDGKLTSPCCQLETEEVFRKNFEIQPELKRGS